MQSCKKTDIYLQRLKTYHYYTSTWLDGKLFLCVCSEKGNLITLRNVFTSDPLEVSQCLPILLHAPNSSAGQPCTKITLVYTRVKGYATYPVARPTYPSNLVAKKRGKLPEKRGKKMCFSESIDLIYSQSR